MPVLALLMVVADELGGVLRCHAVEAVAGVRDVEADLLEHALQANFAL